MDIPPGEPVQPSGNGNGGEEEEEGSLKLKEAVFYENNLTLVASFDYNLDPRSDENMMMFYD